MRIRIEFAADEHGVTICAFNCDDGFRCEVARAKASSLTLAVKALVAAFADAQEATIQAMKDAGMIHGDKTPLPAPESLS